MQADIRYNNRLIYVVLPIYLVLSIIGIYNHEVWLDEAHHFLLARDNASFTGMLHACRYEGHPFLWNALLFLATRVSVSVLGMQWLHISINCITVVLICKSPFTVLEKILIIFSYYIFYEYNVISRNYGISTMLAVAIISLYCKNKDAVIWLSLLIVLLANAHLFAMFLSMAFAVMYVSCNKGMWHARRRTVVVCIIIVLSGWTIAVISAMPPTEYGEQFVSYDVSGYFSAERLLKTITVFLKGIFYMPDYRKYNTANRFIYTGLPVLIQFIIAIAAFMIPIYVFRKKKQTIVLFVAFSIMYLSVYYFLPLVHGVRYFGFFYLLFILCYWLSYKDVSKINRRIVLAIFFLQFINGVYAYTKDILYPYSESKNVSAFIKENAGGKKVFIVNAISRPGIAAYTGEKYPDFITGREGSFCLWYLSYPEDTVMARLGRALIKQNEALVVAHQPIDTAMYYGALSVLKTFDQGFMDGENVTVYRYKLKQSR